MAITVPDNRLHVVVGVVQNADLKLLLQQRLAHQPGAGKWEFPGGKVAPGESAEQALRRELAEELGIRVHTAPHLLNLAFDYTHARVWLQVFSVRRFAGEAWGKEGQPIRWLEVDAVRELDCLAAVYDLLEALALPLSLR